MKSHPVDNGRSWARRGPMMCITTPCPPWCTAPDTPSPHAHGSDGIAVPCVVRAPSGVEVHHLEGGLVADGDGVWAVIESANRGAPALMVEVGSMRRLVAAWEEAVPMCGSPPPRDRTATRRQSREHVGVNCPACEAQRCRPAERDAAPLRTVCDRLAAIDAAELDAPVLSALRVDHPPPSGRALDGGHDRMPVGHEVPLPPAEEAQAASPLRH